MTEIIGSSAVFDEVEELLKKVSAIKDALENAVRTGNADGQRTAVATALNQLIGDLYLNGKTPQKMQRFLEGMEVLGKIWRTDPQRVLTAEEIVRLVRN